MKEEKGMGIAMLGLIVVVIILVITGLAFLISNVVKDNKTETLRTDMLLIQGKLKIIEESVKVDSEKNHLVGIKLPEIKDNEEVNKILEGKEFGDKTEEYYRLGREELDSMTLQSIKLKEDQYFYVNYEEKDVVTNVKQDKENKYYHLSEINK